jgi:uncharacterized protein YcbX
MNKDRETQMDIEVPETSEEQMRNEQIAEDRANERQENEVPTDVTSETLEPLFEEDAARKFRSRWTAIQSKFVDDPRDSVKQADDLVADIIKNVTMNFAERRITLEKQWNNGENISTEDMRQALKRYRSFFGRLLTLES